MRNSSILRKTANEAPIFILDMVDLVTHVQAIHDGDVDHFTLDNEQSAAFYPSRYCTFKPATASLRCSVPVAISIVPA